MTEKELDARFMSLLHKGKEHHSSRLEESSRGMVPVLCFIDMNNKIGNDVTPGMIAKEMHITTARVARLLNNLEAKGIIVREKHENDQRAIVVKLTENGQKEVAKFNEKKFEIEHKIVTEISDEELNSFFDTLEKIKNIMREECDKC